MPDPSSLIHLSALLAQVWVAGTWQGLLLVAAVGCMLRLCPGLGASRRSAVWVIVLGLLVSLQISGRFSALRHGISPSQPGQQTAWSVDGHWTILLAAIWLLVSLVQAARLATGLLRVRLLSRNASPVALETVHPDFSGQVFLSAEITRPCVVGFGSPRILLPVDLPAQLSPAELTQVLLHEQEHIRRGDPWVNLLQKVLLVIFPISPAFLLVDRRLCAERELACDDRVMHLTGTRKAYALCLARIAEHGHFVVDLGTSIVLGAWDRRPELVRRVERILLGQPREMSRWRAQAVAATIVAGALAGCTVMVHAPAPIRFTFADTQEAQSAAPSLPLPLSYGRVEMVKATLASPQAPSALRSARLIRTQHLRPLPPHRIKIRKIRPLVQPPVLLASSPDDRLSGDRVVEVNWPVLAQSRVVARPAVMYVVPTAGGWLVFEL